MRKNSLARAHLTEELRLRRINAALAQVGLTLPNSSYPYQSGTSAGADHLLNLPLKLSEYVRRTRVPLAQFVELARGQTQSDYRPNKNLVPEVISVLCAGYPRLVELLQIANEGVRVQLARVPPANSRLPPNHGSADERVNILRKNIRKDQDEWRCLVLDSDLLEI
ncbi:hypothetical protein PHMEG_00041728 [Phytophthora megakarya]|uniref:Uncharacterized protein n=1 Tax=Phytophthora megakarya TaxID=4795 RepID=A0A225UC81_9STRA|nr:hypothetical protein PHMEG_00041728 [Phytophthora megakarya]